MKPFIRVDKLKDKPLGVTHTQNFAGTIRRGIDGQKTLVMKSERWYLHQLQKFKDGEEVTLVVHNRRPKRTEQQNRYYWGVYLPLIAEESGEKDLDRLHELFKGKFLTKGVVEVMGEKVRLKRSTTELSRLDFSNYIMSIEGFTNVPAPPTPNWDLEDLEKIKQTQNAKN